MTAVNDSVELLFKCKAEGGAEIDKLAASTGAVSRAATAASADISGLEKTLLALKVSVDANTASLANTERGFNGAAEGAVRLAGGARTAANELRMMEGAIPVRAAAQFLTQMQGVSTVMAAAFPIFGAVALVGVLDTIGTKVAEWANAHNPVLEAQKESLSILERTGKEYDRLAEKARKYGRDAYGRQFGKPAQDKLESADYRRAAREEDADAVHNLEALIAQVNRLSRVSTLPNGGVITAQASQRDVGLNRSSDR